MKMAEEDQRPLTENEDSSNQLGAPDSNLTRASSSTSGIASIESKETAIMDEKSVQNRRNVIEIRDPITVENFIPPDGGLRAWMVMLSSCLCNGIVFGIINSFGVVFVYLKADMSDDSSAAAKVSLVGAMAIGSTFLLSPVSGILADQFGIRKTALFGGILATSGMALSSLCVHKIEILCLTYGIMFGCGSSLCYTPSLVILGHYFKRRMGLVNGIVTAGSSICTMVMPFILDGLLKAVGLSNTMLCLAVLTSILICASLTFKPLMPRHEMNPGRESPSCFAKIVKIENWRNKKYVIWALAIPLALFGYFVPYIHIVQYVKDALPMYNGSSLVTCISITSGLGRLFFGFIADMPRVNKILLQQISFYTIGICTMLLVAAPYLKGFEFGYLIAISLLMGVFDGCFITMFGPIAFEICGPHGASQGLGFLLGLCSFPLTLGPPIAGFLHDTLGNYTVAFLAAGVPPLVGATVMFLIYLVKESNQSPLEEDEDENQSRQSMKPLEMN